MYMKIHVSDFLNEKELSTFNRVLNKFLSKKFDWFDHVEIKSVLYNKVSKSGKMEGKIFVDSEWLATQWRKYNYSSPIPEEGYELQLGDVTGGEMADEIREVFSTMFNFVTGYKAPNINSNYLEIYRVHDNKLRESIKRFLKEQSESRRENILMKRFDEVFSTLTMYKTDPEYDLFEWEDENEEVVFGKNDWGMLWVESCEPYLEFRNLAQFLSYEDYDFHELLSKFINRRYGSSFKNKVREISDELNCRELEWTER